MLFQFVKSISQFFSIFFQHRLTSASRLKRCMGMKYSMLSAFVKSISKNFSIFFKSTARSAFPHLERNGSIIYHTFRICQIIFRKISVFFPFQPRFRMVPASNEYQHEVQPRIEGKKQSFRQVTGTVPVPSSFFGSKRSAA